MTKKCVVMVLVCLLAATSFVGCKEETKSSKRTREYDAMILQKTSRKLSSIYSATIRGKQDIDIRLCGCKSRLIRHLVDNEECLSLTNNRALVYLDIGNVALNLRADIDILLTSDCCRVD